jgi:4'-phosphopantetheinyl transferase
VDVWSAALDLAPAAMPRLAACLSPDEHARAGRFVSARDRDRFVAGRSFLRRLLAEYLGTESGDVCFHYALHGKPALAGSDAALRFNLAHADAIAVCAVVSGCEEIGVDVERVRPMAEVEAVARTVLSPRELAHFHALPAAARLHAFYEAWTRKEAFVKALGCGLSRPLDSFDVAFGPGERARLLRSLADPSETTRFTLHAFEPEAGYVGAVAMSGKPARVRHRIWHWNDHDAPAPLDKPHGRVPPRLPQEGLRGLRVDA